VWSGKRPNALWSGTSFSAPQVTGTIAVQLAKMRRRRDGATATARDAFDQLAAKAPQIPNFGARIDALPTS
jgi:hypothetical protein